MLAYKDKVILSSGEMEVREDNVTFNTKANRTYPAMLEMEIPDQVYLRFDVKRIIDCNDLLKELNPIIMNAAVRWLVNRFMRPGWFRFESDFTLRVQHEGRAFEESGTTLHEMVALQYNTPPPADAYPRVRYARVAPATYRGGRVSDPAMPWK